VLFGYPGPLSCVKTRLPFRISVRLNVGIELLDSFRGFTINRFANTGEQLGQRNFEDRFEGERRAERRQTPLFFVS